MDEPSLSRFTRRYIQCYIAWPDAGRHLPQYPA